MSKPRILDLFCCDEKANYADHLQDHWTTLIAALAALHGRDRGES